MDINSQKEYFSYAYVRAVAAVAGYSVEEKSRPMDNAGVDLTIESSGEIGLSLFPKVDAQVKCTASTNIIKIEADTISFRLPRKNYDTLREERLVPLILIVVLVPDESTEWMTISEEEFVMRKCGYWASLKGEPSTKNKETVTVKLSRKNLFTPDNLSEIMKKINNREEL